MTIIKDEKIEAYSLKNAVEHEGKAQAGAVLSSLFAEGLKKEEIKEIMPRINNMLKKINSLSLEEQQSLFSKHEKQVSHRETRAEDELPELDNVNKTGVIMRFAPSASGIMHLGHILTGMPSSLYVKQYGGKFYVRIEDTNPEKCDPEAYTSFPKDCDWVFGNVSEYIIQSDRMEKYYTFAEELIKKGVAFVCTCKNEEDEEDQKSKKNSEERKPREICKCRNNSIKENQEKWKKMLDKKGFKQGEAILRFKSPDTKLTNPALIDFPLARINETKHPRQGNKYRVWPLMNLCVTLDDLDYGMTHVIRAKEHRDNALRQEMIFKLIKKKAPLTYFLGRYKFDDLPLSKSRFQEMIKRGEYSGWNDIRLPLARNFKKRGYQPEAFGKLAIKRGLSEVDKVLKQDDYFLELNNANREIIKDKAIQTTFEEAKGKIKSNTEILMPNASIVKGNSDLNIKKLKEGDIIFFKGLGYVRFNKDEKIPFWFCHK